MPLQRLALEFRTWCQCLVGRNPLVRSSDRLQARALLAIVVVAAVALPAAGAVGGAVYDGRVQDFAQHRATLREIAVTATADSRPANAGYSKYHFTPVRWTVDDTVRTDELRTPYVVKSGERQLVWVDDTGARVAVPLGPEDATTQAVVIGCLLWLLIAGAGGACWFLLRLRLDGSRDDGWERDLAGQRDDGGRTNHDN